MARQYRLVFLSWSCFLIANIGYSQEKDAAPLYATYLKGVLSDIYGEPRRALGEYLKLKKQDEVADLDLRVAIDYIKIKRYSEAVSILEKMRKRETINSEVYVLLSLTYAAWGKKEKAEAVYEEFLNRLYVLYPHNLKVGQALAEMHLKKGELEAAEKIYRSLLKGNSRLVEAYLGLAYVYDEQQKRTKAIELLKEALKKFPDNPELLNSLAYIYAEENINLDRAEIMAKKALEVKPDSAAYLDSLGWIYYKKHRYDLALKYLEQASKLESDPLIKEHLGDVLYALGRYVQAIQCWREIIRNFPQSRKRLGEKIKQAKNEQRRKQK